MLILYVVYACYIVCCETTDACGTLVRWPLTAAGSRAVLALGACARARPLRLTHRFGWSRPLCAWSFAASAQGHPLDKLRLMLDGPSLLGTLLPPLRLNKLESCIIMVVN